MSLTLSILMFIFICDGSFAVPVFVVKLPGVSLVEMHCLAVLNNSQGFFYNSCYLLLAFGVEWDYFEEHKDCRIDVFFLYFD